MRRQLDQPSRGVDLTPRPLSRRKITVGLVLLVVLVATVATINRCAK